MATTRGRLAVAGLATVLIVGAVLAGLSLIKPTPAPVAEPPKVPLVVSVPRVHNQEAASINVPLLVSAHALGAVPVRALELWDGTELAASEEASPGSTSPAFYARWTWTPTSAGEHVLFIRAVDSLGRGVQSGAVRINVAEGAGAAAWPSHAIAAVGGAPVQPRPRPRLISYGLAVPELEVSQDGCAVELKVSGTPAEATGFTIYGLPPSSAEFSPVVVKPAGSIGPLSLGLVGGGSFVFAPSAFNNDQQSFGAPAAVVAPPECAPSTGGWTGDLSVSDGKLLGAEQVDRAYLYLSEGAGAAVRLPAQTGQFVEAAQDGSLDFGALLPPIGAAPLDVEGWGWKAGALVALGKGHYEPPASPPAAGGGLTFGGGFSVGGNPVLPGPGVFTKLAVLEKVTTTAAASPGECSKEFCVIDKPSLSGVIPRPKPNDTKPITRIFQWSTVMPGVTQLVWQIFSYPPPASPDLNPPFIMDQQVINLSPGQLEGEFAIDFAKYLAKGVPSVTNPAPGSQALGSPIFALPGGPAAPTASAGSGSSADVTLVELGNLAAFSDRFYIRVVPLQLNVAVMPSNAVTIDVVEPDGGPALALPSGGEGSNQNAYQITWKYSPPVAANPKYTRCAIVTGFTGDYVAFPVWDQKLKNSFNTGTPICYTPPSDDGWSLLDAFDSFVEFVADVWDYVADGVAWIKKQVVSLVLATVPCDQIASDSTCETIASVAVDMAIVAMTGMPPSLPNFDAALAGLKGDLATLIVESASSLPGVATACGIADAANTVTDKLKSCEELAAEAVDAAIDEMLAAASDAAGQATGYGFPGVKWKADPRGMFHPPSFELTLTRTSDPVLPNTCTVSASMSSLVEDWKFPELHQGVVKNVTADVTGEPFLATSFTVPALKPGETYKRTVWLTQPRLRWFESWRAELYWNYAQNLLNVADFTRAWVLLLQGAELNFHVTSNCAKPSDQGPYVMTQSAWGE